MAYFVHVSTIGGNLLKEELKQLAVDIVDGKVFGSWMIPEEHIDSLLPVIFMPIAFGASNQLDDKVCSLYGYYEEAKRETHDGFPIFFDKMYTLTTNDLTILNIYLNKLKLLKSKFMEEENVENRSDADTV